MKKLLHFRILLCLLLFFSAATVFANNGLAAAGQEMTRRLLHIVWFLISISFLIYYIYKRFESADPRFSRRVYLCFASLALIIILNVYPIFSHYGFNYIFTPSISDPYNQKEVLDYLNIFKWFFILLLISFIIYFVTDRILKKNKAN
jgi:hypothetical protein